MNGNTIPYADAILKTMQQKSEELLDDRLKSTEITIDEYVIQKEIMEHVYIKNENLKKYIMGTIDEKNEIEKDIKILVELEIVKGKRNINGTINNIENLLKDISLPLNLENPKFIEFNKKIETFLSIVRIYVTNNLHTDYLKELIFNAISRHVLIGNMENIPKETSTELYNIIGRKSMERLYEEMKLNIVTKIIKENEDNIEIYKNNIILYKAELNKRLIDIENITKGSLMQEFYDRKIQRLPILIFEMTTNIYMFDKPNKIEIIAETLKVD